MPAARPRPILEGQPQHSDILAALHKRQDDAEQRDDALHKLLEGLNGKLDSLIKALGDEGADQYGNPVGTGIVGRLMRLELRVEKRFNITDGLKKYAAGMAVGIGALASVIWWLIGDKLAHLLKS